MDQINQGNIAVHQEKTSYFVRYSTIWTGLGAISLISQLINSSVNLDFSKGILFTMGSLLGLVVSVVIAGFYVLTFFKVLHLYSSYVDETNATEYKVACDFAGCIYHVIWIIKLVCWILFTGIILFCVLVVIKPQSTGGKIGVWGAASILIGADTISTLIHVCFNCWLYCMYKNHAKPLCEFYMMNSGSMAAKGI